MKDLINDIKNNQFRRVYLLFGQEQYLVRLYEDKIKQKVTEPAFEMMNTDIFEGKNTMIADVENAANTLPFMSEKRLIILRDTGLFVSGRKDETEKAAKMVSDLPDSTLMLFVETEVDRRNKLFKDVTKNGRAVDFKTPSEKELIDWVCRSLKQKNKRISVKDAAVLLRTVENDMATIEGEIVKLADYSGKSDTITHADIKQVCAKSLTVKIFDMVDAIGNKQTETALDIFNNMLVMKESPIMIISMIARQFRLILQSKLWAEKGLSNEQVAQAMGQRSFVVNECLKQARHFSLAALEQALKDCLETDLNIKTGKMNDKLAVEVLILKYSAEK